MKSVIPGFVVALIGLMVARADAATAQTRVFPAAICRAHGQTAGTGLYYFNSGTLQNNGATSQRVVCGLPSYYLYLPTDYFQVDINFTLATTCTLTFNAATNFQSSTGTGKTLALAVGTGTANGATGPLTLNCLLPPQAQFSTIVTTMQTSSGIL